MNTRFLVSTAVALTTLSGAAFGQLGYATPGSVYGNTFDNLAITGGANAWAQDSTLSGFFLYNSASANIPTYGAQNGSSNTGAFTSLGTTDSTERAFGGVASGGAYFGSPASGAIAGWIAFAATNTTGITLTDFSVSFRGEQWRNGGNTSAQTMVLEYGFGATFATVGSWTAPGGSFDFVSPVTGTAAAAVDGNAAGLVTGLGGVVSSLTWNNGDTLWIRWTERNDIGNDHGLAIDDFSFSARAVPTPGAAALLGLGGLALGRRRR